MSEKDLETMGGNIIEVKDPDLVELVEVASEIQCMLESEDEVDGGAFEKCVKQGELLVERIKVNVDGLSDGDKSTFETLKSCVGAARGARFVYCMIAAEERFNEVLKRNCMVALTDECARMDRILLKGSGGEEIGLEESIDECLDLIKKIEVIIDKLSDKDRVKFEGLKERVKRGVWQLQVRKNALRIL